MRKLKLVISNILTVNMCDRTIDLTIVLATLNEIENLPKLTERIDFILNMRKLKYQLLFVDDNSKDGTREFIIDYCKKNPLSKYIFSDHKQSTLIANYRGIKDADGIYIIIMDADLQHPPEYITTIYDTLLDNYDIVITSRYLKNGGTGNRKPLRGVISRGAIFLAKMMLSTSRNITDPVSGYIGLRNGLKLHINDKWKGYEIGIVLRASNPYAKIKEIPYVFKERYAGKSKVTSDISFIQIYIRELLRAKKIEFTKYNQKE
ncbi:glycosyltransferase [Ferroplasma acidiphilum]|uniref:glycosyltransferase n=1 Tax=Ferroplasma acidiphilum TaxID=74969 RepID=UPI002816121D|nr:glycosyltransferase [Ferroplasma acidiphilum]WMT53755.1 MAG: glycosyltransferase [Ferroplasma acidiphilum]